MLSLWIHENVPETSGRMSEISDNLAVANYARTNPGANHHRRQALHPATGPEMIFSDSGSITVRVKLNRQIETFRQLSWHIRVTQARQVGGKEDFGAFAIHDARHDDADTLYQPIVFVDFQDERIYLFGQPVGHIFGGQFGVDGGLPVVSAFASSIHRCHFQTLAAEINSNGACPIHSSPAFKSFTQKENFGKDITFI
jgi:hypothetical protein